MTKQAIGCEISSKHTAINTKKIRFSPPSLLCYFSVFAAAGGGAGVGGYGGNGGLSSYMGYNNNNYNGQRNLGYGYYRNSDQYGFVPSSRDMNLNYLSGTGYRGYN